jgi:acetyltransferase-like isoleucine patch superfamily enzyme
MRQYTMKLFSEILKKLVTRKFLSKPAEIKGKAVKNQRQMCECKGNVHVYALYGGIVEIHPTTLLNSDPVGYHVAMPFDTTLIADREGAVITIGENCRIHGTYIHAWKSITIGKGVLIAAGTNIADSNGHSANNRYARLRRYFQDEPKPVRINDFVWIGMNCTILKGVEIGECSVISAGSVITESIPAFSVAEGNPARVVEQISPADILDANYSLEKLKLEKGFFEYDT